MKALNIYVCRVYSAECLSKIKSILSIIFCDIYDCVFQLSHFSCWDFWKISNLSYDRETIVCATYLDVFLKMLNRVLRAMNIFWNRSNISGWIENKSSALVKCKWCIPFLVCILKGEIFSNYTKHRFSQECISKRSTGLINILCSLYELYISYIYMFIFIGMCHLSIKNPCGCFTTLCELPKRIFMRFIIFGMSYE